LCGELVLAGRRAGYIIIFFGSAIGLLVPVIHMKGTRGVLGGDIGNSGQAFLFVWTLLALGITATFSIILSARALLRLPWRCSLRASTAAYRPLLMVAGIGPVGRSAYWREQLVQKATGHEQQRAEAP